MFSAICRGCAQLKVILLFAAVLALFNAPSAIAQGADLSTLVKDMPEIQQLDENEQADWTQIEQSMAGVSYAVHLPANWEQDNALDVSKDQLSPLLMTEIAHFRGPARHEGVSTLSIQAMQAKPDYRLADWFFDFKRDQNFTLVGLDTLSENEVTFFYVDIEDSISKIYRGKALSLDGMLVLVLHTMPQSVWSQEQGEQAAIINKATVAAQLSAITVEDTDADARYDLKGFMSFVVPDGWSVINKGLNGIDFHYATLKRGSGSINLFYLEGRDEAALSDAIFKVRDLLEGRGYTLEAEPFDYIDNLTFDVGVRRGVVEVSRMKSRDAGAKPQEHWMAIVEGPAGYALISAQTPRRQGQYLAWGQRTRTITQLAESIAFLKAE